MTDRFIQKLSLNYNSMKSALIHFLLSSGCSEDKVNTFIVPILPRLQGHGLSEPQKARKV